MKNPIDEYFSEKTAGFGSGFKSGLVGAGAQAFGRDMGSSLRQGAMGAAGTLAVGAAGAGIQHLYDVATKARDFRSMLESNPDLQQSQQDDPKRFNQMYTTLRTFNPSFSRDPLVAGAIMRQMVSDPSGSGVSGTMMNVLDYRDKMRNPLPDQVARAALGGGKKKDRAGGEE